MSEAPGQGPEGVQHEAIEAMTSARRYTIFAISTVAMTMVSLDSSIVSTALPTLEHELHAPINWAGWTITAYQFGLVIALPVAGRISDQFGRRRVFLFCLADFVVASLLCATAHSIYVLVVCRALQALGGGAFTPSAVGMISDYFGPNRDRAIGMISSTVPIGSLTGPVVGGVIIAYWSWRGVFLINIPIGITLFLLTLRYVPPKRPVVASRADMRGVALLASTVLPVMYAVTALGTGSVSPWSLRVVLPFVVGLAFAWRFVHHLRTFPAPIIPLQLVSKGGFAKLNVINFLYGGCALGIGALLPLYAERRYHFDSLHAGTVLSFRSLGVLTIASTTAFVIRKIGYRRPMLTGFSVAACGMIVLSIAPHGLSPYAWVAIGAAIMGVGNGMAAPATNNASMHLAPSQAGSISGIRQMFRQFGAISVVSVTTAIVARSSDQGLMLGHIYLVLGVVVTALVVPLAWTLPDHRGGW